MLQWLCRLLAKARVLGGILGILLLLVSCQQRYYHISGYTDAQEGADPPLVKLILNDQTIDSAYVRNGKFVLKGKYVDSMSTEIAYLQETSDTPLPIILTTRPLTFDLNTRSLIEGDVLNRELAQLYDSLDSLGDDFKRKLVAIPSDSVLFDTFDQEFKVSIEQYIALAKDYCLRHPNDPVGIISSLMLLTINYEVLFEMVPFIREHMGPLVVNNPEIALYLLIVDNYYRTAPGKPMVDLPLETIEGDPTLLSDHIPADSYTLLHCWAGWCKPCLEEICNLIDVYDAYHSRGLNMVSVFVWDEPYNLNNLKSEYKLQWPQLCDPSSGLTITYGIYSIPEIMLIDPHGTIVARSLRGAEIFSTLDSIFG